MKWILVFCLFAAGELFSQQIKLDKSAALAADMFVGIDSYNHLYYVKNNAIQKDGPLGTFLFNDLQLGPIGSVDIINPLQVVVFYEDTNTVVFLDNRLNETERIGFNIIDNPFNASAVRNAGNNQLWVFNVDTQQLELFNYRSRRGIAVSQPIDGKLISLASDFNNCYVLTENSLAQFNIYGSFISEFKHSDFMAIYFQENLRIVEQREGLFAFSDKGGLKQIPTPLELTIKDLHLSQDFLYIYDGNFLHTFTLTTPK